MKRSFRWILSLSLAVMMVITMIPGSFVMEANATVGDEAEAPFTIGGVDGKYKVTEGAPTSLDSSKNHYVIHLTEEAVSNGSWTIGDDSISSTLFWSGDKVSNGWAIGSIAPTTAPQNIRKNDAGAVFAASSKAVPPPQFFQVPKVFNQLKSAVMDAVQYYYTVESDYTDSETQVEGAPVKGDDFTENMRLSQWKELDLAEHFTDPEGDAMTFFMKEEGQNWTALGSSKLNYYPPGSGEQEVQFKAKDTAGNESGILKATFAVEKPSEKVKIIFSVTRGTDKFYEAENTGIIIKPTELTVPYFDLKKYGLERYYYNPRCYVGHDDNATPYDNGQQPGTQETAEGVVTAMHAFIYATEVLYLGYDESEAGTGASRGELEDVLSWTQGAGSAYMNLWDLGTNLNYYLDFGFPLGAPGWGSTSDQQALYGGEDLSVHAIEGWGAGSSFGFFTIDGTNDPKSRVIETTVNAGESLVLTGSVSVTDYGQPTSFDPMENAALYWCKENDFTANIKDWSEDEFGEDFLEETDEDGNVTINTEGVPAGTYYIAASGGEVNYMELGPTLIKLIVKEGSQEDPPQPHVHRWGDPVYKWAEDNSTCKAERVCIDDDTHKESETSKADSEVTEEATEEKDGLKTFTAKFDNEAFETQTTTEVIPKKPHTHQWGEWTKLDDDQHQRVCEKNNEHVEKQNHQWGAWKETKPASETETGEKEADCSVCGAVKKETIPKLPSNYYEISNADELIEFVNEAPADSTAVLTADIDLEGKTWTGKNNFSGTFDGQHHTIHNMKGSTGLFVTVAGASNASRAQVKNVTVEGTISNGAGIARTAYFADFYNCVNKATITGGSNVGGIVGTAQKASGVGSVSFTNCGNEGDITGSGAVGGIFGYGQSEIVLESCYNKGKITGSGAADTSKGTGGIGGFVQGYNTACTMKNIYNNGDVSGKQAVGGLIGSLRNGVSVTNGYNTGAINGISKVGAIAGSAYNNTSIARNCYYLDSSCNAAAQGNNTTGISATAKSDSEMKEESLIALLGSAFKSTDEYPILIWESYSAEAKIYEVTPPTEKGVEFSGAQSASSEEPYEFRITVDKYHKITDDFAVKINEEKVEPKAVEGKEYSFIVEEPSCDMVVTVEGVESAEEAIWTGSEINPIPGVASYVESINIYNVNIEEKVVSGNNITIILAEGTPLDQMIPFRVKVGGRAGSPTVTPGTTFEKKLAGGKLLQRINAVSSFGSGESTWIVNIMVKNAPEPETVNVIKPDSDLFTITGADKAVKDADYTFTVDIDSRHYKTDDYKVKVNDNEIQPVNGEYILENVQEDITITVEGIVLLTFDHIIAVTPDGEKTVVDDHASVLKGKYDVKMRSGDSGWDTYSGVPYYHVTLPYGTKKAKVAYPSYVWSSTHGQQIPNDGKTYWTKSDVTVKDNIPESGNGQNGGWIEYTTGEGGFKVIELEVDSYTLKGMGNGKGFSPIGSTGSGKVGFYGVITFEVAACDHKGSMTKTEAKDASCTEAGNSAYWSCESCNKYFSDEEGTKEIGKDSWVIKASGHNMTAHEAKAASCTEAGNSAYWSCETCSKFFSDEKGAEEIGKDSWVIDASGHNMTAHEAKDASCTEAGNSAYWSCETCSKFFSDEEGAEEIGKDSWVIKASGHKYRAWEKLDDKQHQRVCEHEDHVEKADHTWGAGKVTKQATTAAAGERTYTCTECRATRTESIPKLTKKDNPIQMTGKSVTLTQAAVKAKTRGLSRTNTMTITNPKGKLTFDIVAMNTSKYRNNFKIDRNSGTITVIRSTLPKGTYRMRVRVIASGDSAHKPVARATTVSIVIK